MPRFRAHNRPSPHVAGFDGACYMQRVSAKEGIRLPYGVQHARQVGSRLTACGLAAIGWELFWDQSFPDRSTSPCPECVHVVARTETYPRGWLPPS